METKASRINKYHQTIIDADDAIDLLLNGKKLQSAILDDKVETDFISRCQSDLIKEPIVLGEEPSVGIQEYHAENCNNWSMPEKYNNIDVKDYVLSKCQNDEQRQRVLHEYSLYEKYNLIKLLQFMIYLVDLMRENKIIWGVGRGSSVCSYILFLIGIHKIDSMKYNLEIEDFLK